MERALSRVVIGEGLSLVGFCWGSDGICGGFVVGRSRREGLSAEGLS